MFAVWPPVASPSSSTPFAIRIASRVNTVTDSLASRQTLQLSSMFRLQCEQFLIASKAASTGAAYRWAVVCLPMP